jgi:hypothetical protein
LAAIRQPCKDNIPDTTAAGLFGAETVHQLKRIARDNSLTDLPNPPANHICTWSRRTVSFPTFGERCLRPGFGRI